jgi:hypothetical protein
MAAQCTVIHRVVPRPGPRSCGRSRRHHVRAGARSRAGRPAAGARRRGHLEGGVINITVDHLPGERAAKPMWLWVQRPDAAHADLDWCRSYLRRFDIEHTFGSWNRRSG